MNNLRLCLCEPASEAHLSLSWSFTLQLCAVLIKSDDRWYLPSQADELSLCEEQPHQKQSLILKLQAIVKLLKSVEHSDGDAKVIALIPGNARTGKKYLLSAIEVKSAC